MTSYPTISIIMPCYNEAARITESIDSIQRQSFSAFELIVVDDGSTDDSLAVLGDLSKQYGFLRYFSQENRGAGPARNRGLKETRGEFIAFLDADDSWHPECLSKLHAKLSSSPDAILAYCGWQNIGLPENRCKPFTPPDYENEEKVESLLRGCRWPIHAALTRRSAIEQANGFDEQWTSCMDYDLWLRIASSGKIVRVPEVLAYYHHHEGAQITKNRVRIAVNHYRIQRKYVEEHPEIARKLGDDKIKEIIEGEHLRRAYISYWERDLNTAHTLFRRVLSNGHYGRKDLKYLIPSLLPYRVYRTLVETLGK